MLSVSDINLSLAPMKAAIHLSYKYKTMIASTIGISLGLIIILLFVGLKQLDKKLVYGVILTGIGFLYVGFVGLIGGLI